MSRELSGGSCGGWVDGAADLLARPRCGDEIGAWVTVRIPGVADPDADAAARALRCLYISLAFLLILVLRAVILGMSSKAEGMIDLGSLSGGVLLRKSMRDSSWLLGLGDVSEPSPSLSVSMA